MVKVIDFKPRLNQAGEQFYVLIVQDEPKPVISKETGKIYFSTSKASVPTTLDEQSCEDMIGKEFEGAIEKVECETYEVTDEETGEVREMHHRYEFVTPEQKVLREQVIDESLVS